MTNLNLETLLALIGAKEVDLMTARRENAELRKALGEAEARIAELTPKEPIVVP